MGREISFGHLYGEHPNVMPVLDSAPDGRWFVMPLANGSADSHAERLRRETGAFRNPVTAVCDGLRQPHTDDRMHRDIKPSNILLLNSRWVVADWGLGRPPVERPAFRAGSTVVISRHCPAASRRRFPGRRCPGPRC